MALQGQKVLLKRGSPKKHLQLHVRSLGQKGKADLIYSGGRDREGGGR